MEKALAKTNLSKNSLWRNNNFLFIWFGSTVSSFGYQMYIIAIPLLIYQLSESALAMSTMRAIEFFPNIFIGMIAGVLVNRYNRKKMMQWTSSIQVSSMSVILLLVCGRNFPLAFIFIRFHFDECRLYVWQCPSFGITTNCHERTTNKCKCETFFCRNIY